MDLIYGLAQEKISSWKKELDLALKFKPEHISCYELTIEARTPLWKRPQIKHKVETIAEFFIFTSQYLESQGYCHYEVSNFARGEKNQCGHNLKYWLREPYIGLGPSAHSFLNNNRWWNISSLRGYVNLISRGKRPIAGHEELSTEQADLETIALGLRCQKGFSLDALRALKLKEASISLLEKEGFIQRLAHRILPTAKGLLVSDSLPLYMCM